MIYLTYIEFVLEFSEVHESLKMRLKEYVLMHDKNTNYQPKIQFAEKFILEIQKKKIILLHPHKYIINISLVSSVSEFC